MNVGRLVLTEGTTLDWGVAVLGICVFCLLVVQARRRANPKRLALRVALSGVAVTSLILLAWQPAWLSSQPGSDTALLATPGASPAYVARLADSLRLDALLALPGVDVTDLAGQDVDVVPDVAYLRRHHPGVVHLHIVGEGVPSYEAALLQDVQVHTYPLPPRSGIHFLDVPRRWLLGQRVWVQGRVFVEETQKTAEPYWLRLAGPGGPVDSIAITEPGATFFSLKAIPRQVGRYRYHLALTKPPGDTLFTESFGASVHTPHPLRLLILQGAPRFEARSLRDWLASEGGVVAVRSTISRARYQTAFVNLPERALTPLTPALLADFDVVLLDRRVWETLNSAERRNLQRAVEAGLGVLVRADLVAAPAGSGPSLFQGFDLQPLDEPHPPARLVWDGDTLVAPIPTESFRIRPTWGGAPLIEDALGREVAAVKQVGAGRVGVSVATETYRWVLEGNAPVHAVYWSYLLSRLARPSEERDQWTLHSPVPAFQDEPLLLAVQTREAMPRGLVFTETTTETTAPDTINLAQDALAPMRWYGTYWPRTEGWYRVVRVGREDDPASSFWFYVHRPSAWRVLQAARKTAATMDMAQTGALTVRAERTRSSRRLPVSFLWFVLPFVVSIAALWVEEKLS